MPTSKKFSYSHFLKKFSSSKVENVCFLLFFEKKVTLIVVDTRIRDLICKSVSTICRIEMV